MAVRSYSVPTGPATSSCGACRRRGGSAVQFTAGRICAGGSPDGQYFYYLQSRADGGLRRIPAGGGGEENVLRAVRGRSWAVTEDGVYFLQMQTGAQGSMASTNRHELLFYDFGQTRQ